MPDFALKLDNVSKRYEKLEEQAMLLRSVIPFWRPKRTEMWAVRDIDLTIAEGETVGVIGRNGAGKTSLLRLLAGVTRPSSGRVLTRGRVAPLISVGVGFHPEMSGRENVYVNGMLLGLTRREVDARFDEIVSFAELEDFIETPVKFYSSGMFMRLGFAVAIHADPDILLVDEVLAVGDFAFQRKCFERMREVQQQGTTIVIVSHSTHHIRALCPRTILMHRGQVQFDGETDMAIALQHELLASAKQPASDAGAAVRVLERELLGPDGPTFHPRHDEPLTFRVRLRFNRPVRSPQFLFHVTAQDGTHVYELRTASPSWRDFVGGEEATVEIPFHQRLGGNTFRFTLHVLEHSGTEHLHVDSEGLVAFVARRPGTVALADLDASIHVDGQKVSEWPELALGDREPVSDGL